MKKLAIVYGEKQTALQKKAIATLSEILLDYTYEYPYCLSCGDDGVENYRCIYIGTKENNAYIRAHSSYTLTHEEEYAFWVENDTACIEGFDDAGVLYGCLDFYNKYLLKEEYPHDDERYRINCFDKPLKDFAYTSYPSVANRGIWTWGHVIYDFRGFIDNMVKLKMNTLIVWNDRVPVNAEDMVAYAHSCGVKVIWGFPWLWDTDCKKIDFAHMGEYSEEIFAYYEREYASLAGDGIYFQTATEFEEQEIGGISVAKAVTDFVNKTAALFYEKYPTLEIQFGLHATSVKTRLDALRAVDPRVRIVWENCGDFPFSYLPSEVDHFEGTTAFVQDIAVLRGEGDRFGVVTKGFTKLDWSAFAHAEQPVHLGVSSESMKKNRITRKRKIWRYIQAYWLTNADKALAMIKEMANAKQGDLVITGLVEDGMFEENIMYPVALYSEMLWDADAPIQQLMSEVALRDYVTFA
ncbi:MAG: hypothetical protein IJY20_00670 [Clostridia bacterium]|nr:hypothetical protein [Clostridia bacterium]